jgi:hypothetical protein
VVNIVLRATFAVAVLGIVVWSLRSGSAVGAGMTVVAALKVRQAAESGRLGEHLTKSLHG